jgi:hypothetical protein
MKHDGSRRRFLFREFRSEMVPAPVERSYGVIDRRWPMSAMAMGMVHAICYLRLSPIDAANVANYPGKPLISLYGGPGRTRTSNQAAKSAQTTSKNPYITAISARVR